MADKKLNKIEKYDISKFKEHVTSDQKYFVIVTRYPVIMLGVRYKQQLYIYREHSFTSQELTPWKEYLECIFVVCPDNDLDKISVQLGFTEDYIKLKEIGGRILKLNSWENAIEQLEDFVASIN